MSPTPPSSRLPVDADGPRAFDPEAWRLPAEAAIPRLLDRAGGRIHALARRICRSDEEADDLLQEVFLQAWRRWETYDRKADPARWLAAIAARACRRMHRRRSGEPTRIGPLPDEDLFGSPALVDPAVHGPLDAAIRTELEERVATGLRELPDELRLPLVFRDILELPGPEVARLLDLPEGTVRSRIHRARLALRRQLAGALPATELPPAAYPLEVCRDLLERHQDALDRGASLPETDDVICRRCGAVFRGLDLTQDLCRALGEGRLAEPSRRRVLDALDRRLAGLPGKRHGPANDPRQPGS